MIKSGRSPSNFCQFPIGKQGYHAVESQISIFENPGHLTVQAHIPAQDVP